MPDAVFFDLDGVLINSEPHWIDVQIAAFAKLDISLTPELLAQTRGLRVSEVIDHWFKRFPDKKGDKEFIANEIIDQMHTALEAKNAIMPGANKAIALVRELGIPFGIVSQSWQQYIEMAIECCQLDITGGIIRSAVAEDYGKPHPAVYLSAAKSLNSNPKNCVVIEDSLNGVIAAKAAQMYCIAMPDDHVKHQKGFALADDHIESLTEITKEKLSKVTSRQL